MELQELPTALQKYWAKIEKEFWAKVAKTEGCWLWQGTLSPSGYGRFHVRNVGEMPAHRFAYEAMHGPVLPELHVDHLCFVRECVNPGHLEPVTPRENIIRSPSTFSGKNIRKTVCPRGHPYSGVNTNGSRICVICVRATKRRSMAKYYARKRLDPEWMEKMRAYNKEQMRKRRARAEVAVP